MIKLSRQLNEQIHKRETLKELHFSIRTEFIGDIKPKVTVTRNNKQYLIVPDHYTLETYVLTELNITNTKINKLIKQLEERHTK